MKNLRNAFFALLLVAGLSTAANAQFMLRLGVGYTGNFATSMYVNTSDDPTATPTYTMAGAGRGLNIQLAPGYRFSEFIGAELGLGYLGMIGKTVDFTQAAGATGTHKQTWTSSIMSVVPSLVLCPFENKFAPYVRTGLFLGFGSAKIEDVQTAGSMTATGTTTNSGGMAFGLQGALGIRYNVSEKLSIFVESIMTNASWTPSSWKQELKTDASSTTVSGTYVDNPKSATEASTNSARTPLNNWGLMVGASMSF